MRKLSAPVLFLLALMVTGGFAGITAGAVFVLDLDEKDVAATTTTSTTAPPLTASQIEVTGTATAATVDGVRYPAIPTPVVITTPAAGEGSGGVVQGVSIGGETVTLTWDAGRPFDLRGDGRSLLPSVVNLALGPGTQRVTFPDDAGVALDPGSYTLVTPVAVSAGDGLASSRDTVGFDAGPESVAAFGGGAFVDLAPGELSLTGPGRVVLEGTLTVRRPDGTTAPAARVELADGPFELTVVPTADGTGWTVTALLQGDVVVA